MQIEEKLTTPVRGEYDVIVCGGGVAGVACAVSARRNGAGRVLLIEKSVLLGGLATIGLISYYEPICDGRGHKLIRGISNELLNLSRAVGPAKFPPEWENDPESVSTDKRCGGFFSPAFFAMALDEWTQADGVELLLDTVIARPVMEGTRCRGVVVENKTGRGFYGAGVVIDATGDLDVMARAGAPCETGGNYLTYVGYVTDRERCAALPGEDSLLAARKWVTNGSSMRGKGHPEGFPLLAGVTAEEVTRFVLAGRKRFYEEFRARGASGECDVTALPAMAQLRTTRHLLGAYVLREEDKFRHFEDSVGAVCDFNIRTDLYEVPFRTLYAPGFDNLLTAGRTASAAGWAWSVMRVIPVAAMTGEAAGAAAAVMLEMGCGAENAPVSRIQQRLVKNGIQLHNNEEKGAF